MKYPKFDDHINSKIGAAEATKSKGRYGIITGYDKYTNTATVILSAPDSAQIGEILTGVPCPVMLGVQSVAPEPGRPCWVVFKGDRESSFPLIITYFNYNYEKFDYNKHYNTKAAVPSYMLSM